MKRRFRLRQSNDIQRVRRQGKAYAHPLFMLVVLSGNQTHARIGIVAGRRVGNAVLRNRAKRRIRTCFDQLLPEIKSGWDVLVFARQPINSVMLPEIHQALAGLLQKANVLDKANGT